MYNENNGDSPGRSSPRQKKIQIVVTYPSTEQIHEKCDTPEKKSHKYSPVHCNRLNQNNILSNRTMNFKVSFQLFFLIKIGKLDLIRTYNPLFNFPGEKIPDGNKSSENLGNNSRWICVLLVTIFYDVFNSSLLFKLHPPHSIQCHLLDGLL